MKSFPFTNRMAFATIAVLIFQAAGWTTCFGQQQLRFQQPSQAAQGSRVSPANVKFRSPSARQAAAKKQTAKRSSEVASASYDEPVAETKTRKKKVTKKQSHKQISAEATQVASRKQKVRRDSQVVVVAEEAAPIAPVPVAEPEMSVDMPMIYESGGPCRGDCSMGDCNCEVSCGMGDPSCGLVGPSCGCAEPGCGICEPECGLIEPGCGIGVNCGSCVGSPGADYWCFPVCLPRFKDLSFWGGVQGFRGPRDFAPGPFGGARSDSNFGFHEGINVSGRAPLIGLLFPQLSYQLGYQAVQSRLSGTATSSADRSQQFVTGGFFRRVKTGLQFGVVWDMLRDDLDVNVDFQQIRTEFSLKSPRGRELGFWSTTGTNSNTIFGVNYETVDQYALFYRWNFGKNYECRLWGGATGDSEGIFGGEVHAPLSDRWSVQSGFNYLITDQDAGLAGVQEEAWNIGIHLVWHMGRTARRGCQSPYRPLFAVADNGWMIVDN